jgi:hypothetical protein
MYGTTNIKLIKIISVGTELFYADGQTDRRDEANSQFSNIFERTQQIYGVWRNNMPLFSVT